MAAKPSTEPVTELGSGDWLDAFTEIDSFWWINPSGANGQTCTVISRGTGNTVARFVTDRTATMLPFRIGKRVDRPMVQSIGGGTVLCVHK